MLISRRSHKVLVWRLVLRLVLIFSWENNCSTRLVENGRLNTSSHSKRMSGHLHKSEHVCSLYQILRWLSVPVGRYFLAYPTTSSTSSWSMLRSHKPLASSGAWKTEVTYSTASLISSSLSSPSSLLWLLFWSQLCVSTKARIDLKRWRSDHSRHSCILRSSFLRSASTCTLHCFKLASKFCSTTPWYSWLTTSILLFTSLTVGHSLGSFCDKDFSDFTDFRVFSMLIMMSAPSLCSVRLRRDTGFRASIHGTSN